MSVDRLTPSDARDVTELRLLIKECLIPRIDKLETENRLLRETLWPAVGALAFDTRTQNPHDGSAVVESSQGKLCIKPWMDVLDVEDVKRMAHLRYNFMVTNVGELEDDGIHATLSPSEGIKCARRMKILKPENDPPYWARVIDEPFEDSWAKVMDEWTTRSAKKLKLSKEAT